LICRLTTFGVTKEATGEGNVNDENCGTIAEAQAVAGLLGLWLRPLPLRLAAALGGLRQQEAAAGLLTK
jgi:hypothetical protein